MNPSEIKILLVDDEPDILEIVGYNLSVVGYQVFAVDNGIDAVDMVRSKRPHLVLLDVMMPDLDGIETCEKIREIRGSDETIVAFLSARDEDFSIMAGYKAGADDYIKKPIKPKMLLKKVAALLRRIKTGDFTYEILQRGNLKLDDKGYKVTFNEEEITLPKKEFELLYLLASKPGIVIKREEIFGRIWGFDTTVNGRTLDVHVRKLRKKFGDEKIITVKGIGYKFIN